MLLNYAIDGFENSQHQDYYALQKIIDKLNCLYRLHGYHAIKTPTFETYDLYVNEASIPGDDLFKLINHQGKVLVLKPDATLPITRMAAMTHANPKDIIKFSYQTNIYRNFFSSEMVKKEITQMGIEYFGNKTAECDGEVIGLAILSLLKNDIKDVHIDLGHVGFINFLFEELNLSLNKQEILFDYIENKNIGDILHYLKTLPLSKKHKDIILKLPKLYGTPEKIITEMKNLCLNDKMEAVVQTISDIYKHLEIMGLSQYVSFDLGFTNQMNYYSDIIFKGYINNWGEPVISGGRYNNLSKKFGISRPACGFAIDLLKIMDYMEQENCLIRDSQTNYVIFYMPSDKEKAYALSKELREANQIAEVFLLTKDLNAMIFDYQKNPLYEHAKLFCLEKNKLLHLKNDQWILLDTISWEVL